MSDGGLLTADQLGIKPRRDRPAPPGQEPARAATPGAPSAQSLSEWEKHLVLDVLTKTRGNKSRAAKVLGITRSQLYSRLKRFGTDTRP